MYGVKPDLDLGFLISQELSQLALGRYEYQLRFSGESNISIQCEVLFYRSGGSKQIAIGDLAAISGLHVLLGRKVTEARVIDRNEVCLGFDGEYKLTIIDSNDHYESFVIWNKGDFVAV
jgi:hypothetical protein